MMGYIPPFPPTTVTVSTLPFATVAFPTTATVMLGGASMEAHSLRGGFGATAAAIAIARIQLP